MLRSRHETGKRSCFVGSAAAESMVEYRLGHHMYTSMTRSGFDRMLASDKAWQEEMEERSLALVVRVEGTPSQICDLPRSLHQVDQGLSHLVALWGRSR